MIIQQEDFIKKTVENARGGEGSVEFCHVVQGEDLPDNSSLCARVNLGPGDSVGYHIHEKDAEMYLVIEGELEADDNHEQVKTLRPGDVMITGGGKGHSLSNRTDKPAAIWAIIVESGQ